jgi:hypothetical protein
MVQYWEVRGQFVPYFLCHRGISRVHWWRVRTEGGRAHSPGSPRCWRWFWYYLLFPYMTSYLDQAYRLSILIDKPTLFINSWLINLWVDNVLLINTRSLSIVIDKPIPLSIGTSRSEGFLQQLDEFCFQQLKRNFWKITDALFRISTMTYTFKYSHPVWVLTLQFIQWDWSRVFNRPQEFSSKFKIITLRLVWCHTPSHLGLVQKSRSRIH